jgi:rsbT co-antagonist protein RsbR
MNSISKVAEYLIKNAELLAVEIVDYNIDKIDFEVPKEIIKKSIIYQTEFIKYLSEAITYNDEEQVAKGFIEWNKEYGQQEEFLLDKVSNLVKPYPDFRLFFTKRFTSICTQHELSIEEAVTIISRLNYILDISLAESILVYEQHTYTIDKKRVGEIIELSAPVVPIQDGLAVLPLIGSIDTNRAKYLLEKAVPKIAEMKIECLVIDFSGIVMVDTVVANHIFRIHDVLRLLGINTIATGIRPELAQTVVSGGIDFSSIKTYATVRQAIENWK